MKIFNNILVPVGTAVFHLCHTVALRGRGARVLCIRRGADWPAPEKTSSPFVGSISFLVGAIGWYSLLSPFANPLRKLILLVIVP